MILYLRITYQLSRQTCNINKFLRQEKVILHNIDFDYGYVDEDNIASSDNQSTISIIAFSTVSLLDSSLSLCLSRAWWWSVLDIVGWGQSCYPRHVRRSRAGGGKRSQPSSSRSLRSLKTDSLLIQAMVLLQGRLYSSTTMMTPQGRSTVSLFQSPLRLHRRALVLRSCKCWARFRQARNDLLPLVGKTKWRGLFFQKQWSWYIAKFLRL